MTGARHVQATVVARHGPRGWNGVALTGASGSGKSELALRLMAHGWRLVADDAARVWTDDGRLWARAPDIIAGRIEARGLGLLALARRDHCRVALVVHLGPGAPERLPEPDTTDAWGLALPLYALRAHGACAPEWIALALERVLEQDLTRGAGGA